MNTLHNLIALRNKFVEMGPENYNFEQFKCDAADTYSQDCGCLLDKGRHLGWAFTSHLESHHWLNQTAIFCGYPTHVDFYEGLTEVTGDKAWQVDYSLAVKALDALIAKRKAERPSAIPQLVHDIVAGKVTIPVEAAA